VFFECPMTTKYALFSTYFYNFDCTGWGITDIISVAADNAQFLRCFDK
jgi:hypothetical protein